MSCYMHTNCYAYYLVSIYIMFKFCLKFKVLSLGDVLLHDSLTDRWALHISCSPPTQVNTITITITVTGMRIILNLQNSNFDSPLFSFTLFMYIHNCFFVIKVDQKISKFSKVICIPVCTKVWHFFAWGLEGGDFLPVYNVFFIII